MNTTTTDATRQAQAGLVTVNEGELRTHLDQIVTGASPLGQGSVVLILYTSKSRCPTWSAKSYFGQVWQCIQTQVCQPGD